MDYNKAALEMHEAHHGKVGIVSKVDVRSRDDLATAYTPGVAEPCRKIAAQPGDVYRYTFKGNMVAVVSNGTAVLGLGNIGPEAALPVMEGKAVLFKQFGGVDAFPVCIDAPDAASVIAACRAIAPTFGGINLEDIKSPECFEIEQTLEKELDIPVFHDDQHGTAIACLSAVMGALRYVKKDIKDVKVVVNGCGAAGSAIGRLFVSMGFPNVIMVERVGALYKGIDAKLDKIQRYLSEVTNPNMEKGTLAEVAKGADILVGVSGPNLFTKEIIGSMADKAIVFGLANPVPETSYDAAIAAGAAVAGTGRSDSPNQVNNVTVFPGVFRGAIDVRARAINEEMKVAAVYAIANLIDEKDLRADYVVPDAFDPRVAPAVAAAVAKAAMETGVARVKVDPEVVRANALKRIGR